MSLADVTLNNARLMQGDCFERMAEIPAGSIDMVLTDPPYELSQDAGGGMMKPSQGREFMNEIHALEISTGFIVEDFLDTNIRLFASKQQFCGVYFCSVKQLNAYISWAEDNKLQYGVAVWHKTNPPPLCNNKYLGDLEFIVWMKGKKSKILGEYKTKSLMYSSSINKKDKQLYGHPTIKPIELLEKFITNHTTEDAVILDPFMGSGSTGVAAANLNRQFIGIEKDTGYYQVAVSRILKGE